MNTGFNPEVAVLALSLGLLFSLVCYLVSNLSPGGMITPGWMALVVVEDPRRLLLLLSVVFITVLTMNGVRKVVILYGKRLFATTVMAAVFIQMTAFFILIDFFPGTIENTTLGFIVPGLIAYQLIRQPVVATLGAITTVTALTYGVMLTGVVFDLIPGSAAPTFPAALEFTPPRIAFILISVGLGLGGIVWQTRRVQHLNRPPMAARSSQPAEGRRADIEGERAPLTEPVVVPDKDPAPVHDESGAPPTARPPLGGAPAPVAHRRSMTMVAVIAALGMIAAGLTGYALGREGGEDGAGSAGSGLSPLPTAERDGTFGDGTPARPVRALQPLPSVCRADTPASTRPVAAIVTRRGGFVSTGALVRHAPGGAQAPVRWSPAGRVLADARGRVLLGATKAGLSLFDDPVRTWTWLPGSRCALGLAKGGVVSGSVSGGTTRLYAVQATSLSVAPDGALAAATVRERDGTSIWVLGLRERSFDSITTLRTRAHVVLGPWSGDSRHVALRVGRSVRLIDARRGAPVASVRGVREWLGRCGEDGLLVRLRRGVATLLSGSMRRLGPATAAACSADGRVVALPRRDGTVVVVSDTGRPITTLNRFAGGRITQLSWGAARTGVVAVVRHDDHIDAWLVPEGGRPRLLLEAPVKGLVDTASTYDDYLGIAS